MSVSHLPEPKPYTAALDSKTLQVKSRVCDAAVQTEALPEQPPMPCGSPALDKGTDGSNPIVKPLQSRPRKRRREDDGASDDAAKVRVKSERPQDDLQKLRLGMDKDGDFFLIVKVRCAYINLRDLDIEEQWTCATLNKGAGFSRDTTIKLWTLEEIIEEKLEIVALHGLEKIGQEIVVKVDFTACLRIPRERDRFWEALGDRFFEYCC